MRVSKKRLVLIIAITVVVLAGAGVAFWYFLWPKPTDVQQQQTATAEQIDKVVVEAQTLATNGKPEESYALLDSEIKKSDNNEVKASFYKSKASIAKTDTNAGINQAIEYALEADKTDPTSASAAYIGSLYESNKDIPNAIKYYQFAYDREPDNSNTMTAKSTAGVSKRPMYQAIIENLKNG